MTLPLQPAAPQLLDALATGLSGVVTNGDDPATMLKGVQTSRRRNSELPAMGGRSVRCSVAAYRQTLRRTHRIDRDHDNSHG